LRFEDDHDDEEEEDELVAAMQLCVSVVNPFPLRELLARN